MKFEFMNRLKALLNNQWFFPVLFIYYGVFYILFGEVYPGGASVDGAVFQTLIHEFRDSYYFDSYYVYRIFPPLLVRGLLMFLSIDLTNENIILCFQLINIGCIAFCCYFFKKIFILFKITLKNQLLGFVLFLVNFAIIKYPLYFPIMTDALAMFLSTALLYYYIKNNTIAIVICTLLLAFTWPMGFYQGLLLIAFPFTALPFLKPPKWQKVLVNLGAITFALMAILIIVFIIKRDADVLFVLKIDRLLLPLSIAGVLIIYYFFAKIFLNYSLLNWAYFIKKINIKRILISIGVFALISLTVYLLNPKPIPTYTTAQMLQNPFVYALIKPLLSLVSHIAFFGVGACLIILFWPDIGQLISQMGWGLVFAFGLNLLLFGLTPESRHLINIFPWLLILLIKVLNNYSFLNYFYTITGLLSIFLSKIWLLLNTNKIAYRMNFDKNGSMDFPDQKFWMNFGPWMNEQMYYIQGGAIIIILLILIFTLYKIKINGPKIIQLVPKFKSVKKPLG